MELLLENGLFSGLKQEGICITDYPAGRYLLRVVREEETKVRVGQLQELLCPVTLSCFPSLLLTLAQRAHFSEAVWLTIL